MNRLIFAAFAARNRSFPGFARDCLLRNAPSLANLCGAACLFFLLIGDCIVAGADEPPPAPTVQEIERAFRLLWLATTMPGRDAKAVAGLYGAAAVPALEKISDQKETFETEQKRTASLTALALLSDDKQAFETLRRRSENDEANWLPVLMFMPPKSRDDLLWEALERDRTIARPMNSFDIRDLIIALAETGTRERLESLVESARTNLTFGSVSQLVEVLVADRARVARMSHLSESNIIALNAASVAGWRRARAGSSRDPVGEGMRAFGRADLIPPMDYLLAREAYPKQPQQAFAGDADGLQKKEANRYLGFCAAVAKWLALRDIPAIGQIALDRIRDQDLRRAAVALLVKTPEEADDAGPPVGTSTSLLMAYSANSISELKYLAKNGQPDLLTWIVEEIIARPKTRPEFKTLLTDLSDDERLTPELRQKCKLYTQRSD